MAPHMFGQHMNIILNFGGGYKQLCFGRGYKYLWAEAISNDSILAEAIHNGSGFFCEKVTCRPAAAAGKKPRRSDLILDFKFMAQITYATMFVWSVFTFF